MTRRLWIINVILAGVGGFLLGIFWPRTMASISAINSPALRATHQGANSHISNRGIGMANAPLTGGDSLLLPRSMLAKYWPSPLINYKLGKFQTMSFFIYGLTMEQTTALVAAINTEIDNLFNLELEHSKLITDTQGNQYIVIEEFKNAGQLIKDRLSGIALNSCKDFQDQRGELLAESLVKNTVFNSFGQYRRELSIEEAVNGDKKKYVLKIRSPLSGGIKEESNVEMSGNYEADRFQKLVEKHLASKGD